ncbi:MAG: molybdopterin-guanine dinucleotide biosynthesis protein B [Promethearchaeia archaeon]
MRIFAISGFSGTGKTTLVEKLVKKLIQRGYSVGVVKSSKEDILPPEGTDTYRHLKASARPVVLLGPETTTIRYKRRLPPSDLFSQIDADLVLLEGFKSAKAPRVLCVGDQEIQRKNIPEQTHALVSWLPTKKNEAISIPILKSDNINKIANIVEKHAVDSSNIQF